jgi:hypothetical protein
MAPQVVAHPGTRPTERMLRTVDDESVARVWRGEEDTHPHACAGGLVFLTYTIFDEEIGEEVEMIEALPCRRCAESEGSIG